ncbi:DUF4244 domain-containing protein [Streptomyces sp. JNUCC 64]
MTRKTNAEAKAKTKTRGKSSAELLARVRAGVRAASGAVRSPMGGRGTDRGVVTSEYAVGLIAAVGFAGLLYKVLTSQKVRAALQGLVERALDVHP